MAGGAAGRRFGRYLVVDQVARRPWAVVFRAEDPTEHVEVRLTVADAPTDDPRAGDRLRDEVRAVGAIDHAGVVPVLGLGQRAGRLWVAEPWSDQPTLAAELADSGPLDGARLAALAADLSDALATAHRAGVVHGGPMPEDVLVGEDGARLGGFALWRTLAGGGGGADEPPPDHPELVAPERRTGSGGFPADCWSLGALLRWAAGPGEPTDPEAAAVLEATRRTSAADPAARATAVELRAGLNPVIAPGPDLGAEPDGPARPRWPRWAMVACAVLAAVGVVGAVLLGGGRLGLWGEEDEVLADVPEVVGLPSDVAADRLEDAGFGVQRQSQESTTVPRGSVVAQGTAPGTALAVGERVVLVVSTGAGDVEVPDLVGLAEAEAVAAATDAGLVAVVEDDERADQPPGRVVSQSPAAGTVAEAGAEVTLRVARTPG